MGGWGLLLGAGLTAGAVLDASAQIADSPCASGPTIAGRVANVIDGRSFVLDDGREVRIVALEVPADSVTGHAARNLLDTALSGRTVELRPAGPPDRYGRIVAHVYPKPGGPSAAHLMLARGYARVGAQTENAACAADLLSQERVARGGRLGLWSDPDYAIVDATNLTGLVAARGRFTLATGKVLSVRESRGTIFVNFGRRWTQALTVTISKRQERMFTAAGLAPKGLEHRDVRVRGWVEIRNGPRIQASRPEQIEMAGLN
jgi:endonuclease YncB( thermonuclease family)